VWHVFNLAHLPHLQVVTRLIDATALDFIAVGGFVVVDRVYRSCKGVCHANSISKWDSIFFVLVQIEGSHFVEI
jgi:hypothetical protein